MAELDVFKANRQLETALNGKPNKITETRTGTLIVEVKNQQQSTAIRNISTLADTEVDIIEHEYLNQTKGTIWYANQAKYSEEKLLEELKPLGAQAIYQTKKRLNNVLVPTPVYIITFKSCTLPAHINLGWTRCPVRLYIPRPRRCLKCQAFGHGAAACRKDATVCYNCSGEQHPLPCTNPPRCANCFLDHPSSSSNCPNYKMEAEILALQTKERMSYQDAKRAVKARHVRNNDTFADVARLPNTNNRNTSHAGGANIIKNAVTEKQVQAEREHPIVIFKPKGCDSSTQTEHSTRERTYSLDLPRQSRPSGCGIGGDDFIIALQSRKRQGDATPPTDRHVKPKIMSKPIPEGQNEHRPEAKPKPKSKPQEKGRGRLPSHTSAEARTETQEKQILKSYPVPANAPTIPPPTSVSVRHWSERQPQNTDTRPTNSKQQHTSTNKYNTNSETEQPHKTWR